MDGSSQDSVGEDEVITNYTTEINDDDVIDDKVDEPTEPRYDLREKRGQDYSYKFDHQFHQFLQVGTEVSEVSMYQYCVGICMNQMTATAGIKKHGEVAVQAIFKEFAQIEDKGVIAPLVASELTREQRSGALRAISLIKEKRCGKIKGRTCADGRSQRHLYSKEETSSKTVSTEALMISLMIDAKEGRDVAIADVAGAFLHADLLDFVIMKLEGKFVDIMCSVNPAYKDYVVFEGGKKVLYLRLLKALYGTVKASMLWYNLFVGTLLKLGFRLNPYDPCVANAIIKGKQCSVVWYVDDNKVSHVRASVVSKIIKAIEADFGEMTVTRGTSHTFIGMDIFFPGNGTVRINMKTYLQEAIDQYKGLVTKTATTPAKKNLFEIKENVEQLKKGPKERFHSVVMKLLWCTHRGRPDIQLPIGFLCTRIAKSDEADEEKLIRALEFLLGTIDDDLVLSADSLNEFLTWVDASHAVHDDMRGHTGGCQSLGQGVFHSKSLKQKLNSRSTTETEVIGASDYMPFTMFTKGFLSAQGYEMKEGKFFQDNEAAEKLEKNGRASSSQKTRHIDIRYFWMKDRIKTENIRIVHCPTEIMLADFFTKPLQGSLFRKFRDVLMGYKHTSSLVMPTKQPSKERVGDILVMDDSLAHVVTKRSVTRGTNGEGQKPLVGNLEQLALGPGSGPSGANRANG
jgi:hypothetical protein